MNIRLRGRSLMIWEAVEIFEMIYFPGNPFQIKVFSSASPLNFFPWQGLFFLGECLSIFSLESASQFFFMESASQTFFLEKSLRFFFSISSAPPRSPRVIPVAVYSLLTRHTKKLLQFLLISAHNYIE